MVASGDVTPEQLEMARRANIPDDVPVFNGGITVVPPPKHESGIGEKIVGAVVGTGEAVVGAGEVVVKPRDI